MKPDWCPDDIWKQTVSLAGAEDLEPTRYRKEREKIAKALLTARNQGRDEGLEEAAGKTRDMRPGLSAWEGWDQSRLPWSECKHKDAVLEALFEGPWSMEDADALIGFIDRTLGSAALRKSQGERT